jgi:hypothetical protein
VARFAPLVEADPAGVVVRDLGAPLGRLTTTAPRTVGLPLAADTQPSELVDYVVVLRAGLRADHGPAFWRRVADVVPDCKSAASACPAAVTA